jgi:DMSO/TMAO reductase YedYZ molybdopterin-dependent catalytic subunit
MKSAFGVRGIPVGMEERVPAGQYVTPKMPVMNLSYTPRLDLERWSIKVSGLVEKPQELSWPEFQALDGTAEVVDFHCVTQWTRLNVAWEGVPVAALLELAVPTPEARYVMVHGADGYTTNMPLSALQAPQVLLAHMQDGKPLECAHGFPARLVVPALYGWKSAKWVTEIELMAEERAGFWEMNGYHMRGDPWREERFS